MQEHTIVRARVLHALQCGLSQTDAIAGYAQVKLGHARRELNDLRKLGVARVSGIGTKPDPTKGGPPPNRWSLTA